MKKSPTRFIRRVDNKFTSASLDLNFQNMEVMDSRVTFSRGSNATLFDSSGNLVYAKHNLLLQSEDFNTTWFKASGTTITVNDTEAPDQTISADKFAVGSSTFPQITQSANTTVSAAHAFSIYAKNTGVNFLQLRVRNAAATSNYFRAVFNLTTGEVTSATGFGNGSIVQASAVDVGNGWWRLSVSGIADTSGTQLTVLAILCSDSSGNVATPSTNNATDGVFLWGAQLNITPMEGGVTSSLSTYYPTVASAYYAPRFDHNPTTLESLGLLIEEQRTNSIRNNTMQGAVAGTPGTLPTGWQVANAVGLTTNVIGFGLVNGISYLDFQVTGTPNSTTYAFSPEANNQIVAASGQSWTSSAYLGIVGGSINNISSIILRARAFNSGGGGTEASAGTDRKGSLTSSLQRFSESLTLSNATTAFINQQLLLNVTAGVAIDITIRIGLPQLEQGAFATSVIPTTTAAATRNEDRALITGSNFTSFYNNAEGTIYAEFFRPISTGAVIFPRAFDFYSTTTADKWNLNILNNRPVNSLAIYPSASPSVAFSSISYDGNNPVKTSFGIKIGTARFSVNGSLNASDISITAMPVINELAIGAGEGGGVNTNLNGHIQRIAYYPVRLSDDQIQALTR